jgi:hypothetical protein
MEADKKVSLLNAIRDRIVTSTGMDAEHAEEIARRWAGG